MSHLFRQVSGFIEDRLWKHESERERERERERQKKTVTMK